jgi:hypothetical protein
VAGSIGRRIEALEGVYGREPCEECGDGGEGPETTWEVVWVDPHGPAESKRCGTCGRPFEIVITWGEGA